MLARTIATWGYAVAALCACGTGGTGASPGMAEAAAGASATSGTAATGSPGVSAGAVAGGLETGGASGAQGPVSASGVDASTTDANAADATAAQAHAPETGPDAAMADAAIADVAEAAALADAPAALDSGPWRSLMMQPSPVDNPLKGFMPYRGSYVFPHSMEWFYVPLRALMTGPTTFAFDTGLEPQLNDIASRGHQAVFRVYLDYPSLPTGVPQYLIDGGLLMRPYTDYGGGQSPDYENPALVAALKAFISALGARYDGDPRVGFITEGLLGFWGEWHTYPHVAWFASVATQNAVLHGYANAFSKTRLLVRIPTADSPNLPVGYHDDSFAYETLPPTSYNFWPLLTAAGLQDVWRTQPIGGELRPEIQSSVFDVPPVSPDPYPTCVTTTHASWLLNQTAFNPSFTGAKLTRALAGSAMLGYDLRVTSARVSLPSGGSPVHVDVQLSNVGVAPFYYDWPVEVAVLSGNSVIASWHPSWKLTSILPGPPALLSTQASVVGLSLGGPYTVGIRVPNPLVAGPALRFGNVEQESVWLRLAP